jgi:hypothetical protein
MAVCLNYQAVYYRKDSLLISSAVQIGAAILLLAALITRVWLSIETTEIGYRLARERQKTVEMDMERRELELQLSVQLRPDNLTERAGKRLGLKPLNPEQARKIVF